jgi:hypothetical protein
MKQVAVEQGVSPHFLEYALFEDERQAKEDPERHVT